MTLNALLEQIQSCSPGKQVAEAPVYAGDAHAGLMTTRKGFIKYALNENGQIHGLNLSDCDLDDAAWQRILQALHDAGCRLRDLNLSGNRITRFDFRPELENLEHLDLSENEALQKVEFSAPLLRLERMVCASSGLETLAFPGDFLPVLKWLDLRGNALASISFEGACQNLVWLDLSSNALDALPLKNGVMLLRPQDLAGILPRIESLRLAKNPLPDALNSFLENGGYNALGIVQRYLRELEKDTPVADNECKLLLIGNGNVGKTCFTERLVRKRFVSEWASTHAIIIEEQFPLGDWLLNIWDFGGQDIYHATHRLFMQANSVYLLFWDLLTEADKVSPPLQEAGETRQYENYPVSYWLDYAYSRSKGNAPVLVVQTKVHQAGHEKKDLPDIRKNYAKAFSMLEFHHIDSALPDPRKNGFRNLLNDIETAVSTLKPAGGVMPANYSGIRRQLRELRQAGQTHLLIDDYLNRAGKLGIEDPMDVLERWLTGTGVVFYRKGLFQDQIILDQAWAIKAIYTLFDRNRGGYYYEILSRNGRFTGENLLRFWTDTATEAECELFLSFMLSCELCFEITPEQNRWSVPFAERSFIAPQLLPEQKPRAVEIVERSWRQNPALEMLYLRYSHKFLHYGIMQSFIVRTQALANVDDIWRYGILLEENGLNVLVESAGKNEILVQAPITAIRLFEKVGNLLRHLKESEAVELVSYDGTGYVDWRQIRQWPSKNPVIPGIHGEQLEFKRFVHFLQWNEQASFENAGSKGPVAEVLSEEKTPRPSQQIFFSYAWGDNKETGQSREKIVDELYEVLKGDGFNVVRDKKDLAYGGLISEFMEQMGRGDLIVVFISDKYVKSPYCMFELYEIARNSKLDKKLFSQRVLPIIVESIKFDDPLILEPYFAHWEGEEKKWEELITRRMRQMGEAQTRRYNLTKKINAEFGNLVDWLSDINASTIPLLSEDDFELVKAAILDRFNQNPTDTP